MKQPNSLSCSLTFSGDGDITSEIPTNSGVSSPAPSQELGERAAHNGRAMMAGECRSIDWYSEGQERVVEVAGVRIVISYVGRKGRRARIAITAPSGTTMFMRK